MFNRLIALIATLLALGAALLLAGTAFAGGFAIANLDSSPPQPRAGEATAIGFTVLQHGVTPWTSGGVSVTARDQATGRTINANAVAEGKPGHYVATLTFPAAGTWAWEIQMPLEMNSKFPPLTVVPASAAPASAPAEPAPAGVPGVALGGLIALAAVLVGAAYLVRRRPQPAVG